MLRRYGEQALQEEIRALMKEWEEDLEASERIFLRASTHGKKSFWGYEGAVLGKNDSRVRVFPFPTRRPVSSWNTSRLTLCVVCWKILTSDPIRAFTMLARAHPGQSLPSHIGCSPSSRRSLHRFPPAQAPDHQICAGAYTRSSSACCTKTLGRRGSLTRSTEAFSRDDS
jgi:hypothetical protein